MSGSIDGDHAPLTDDDNALAEGGGADAAAKAAEAERVAAANAAAARRNEYLERKCGMLGDSEEVCAQLAGELVEDMFMEMQVLEENERSFAVVARFTVDQVFDSLQMSGVQPNESLDRVVNGAIDASTVGSLPRIQICVQKALCSPIKQSKARGTREQLQQQVAKPPAPPAAAALGTSMNNGNHAAGSSSPIKVTTDAHPHDPHRPIQTASSHLPHLETSRLAVGVRAVVRGVEKRGPKRSPSRKSRLKLHNYNSGVEVTLSCYHAVRGSDANDLKMPAMLVVWSPRGAFVQ